jgi:hypothetical protein
VQGRSQTEAASASPLSDGGVPAGWERAPPRQGAERQAALRDGQRQQLARQALRRADADALQPEAGLAVLEALLDPEPLANIRRPPALRWFVARYHGSAGCIPRRAIQTHHHTRVDRVSNGRVTI